MPESKGRKKTPYTPPPSKGERKVAKIGSPGWLAPALIACFVIGLVYIVLYYVAGSQIPIMNSIGGAANGLVNVAIGFAFTLRVSSCPRSGNRPFRTLLGEVVHTLSKSGLNADVRICEGKLVTYV